RHVLLPPPSHSQMPVSFSFFFYCSGDHRDLHSFPTRRSSDLDAQVTTLRERLLKLAVWVERSVRRIVLHLPASFPWLPTWRRRPDRKSTRLNSSHDQISYAVFCLKKKNKKQKLFTDATLRVHM